MGLHCGDLLLAPADDGDAAVLAFMESVEERGNEFLDEGDEVSRVCGKGSGC